MKKEREGWRINQLTDNDDDEDEDKSDQHMVQHGAASHTPTQPLFRGYFVHCHRTTVPTLENRFKPRQRQLQLASPTRRLPFITLRFSFVHTNLRKQQRAQSCDIITRIHIIGRTHHSNWNASPRTSQTHLQPTAAEPKIPSMHRSYSSPLHQSIDKIHTNQQKIEFGLSSKILMWSLSNLTNRSKTLLLSNLKFKTHVEQERHSHTHLPQVL